MQRLNDLLTRLRQTVSSLSLNLSVRNSGPGQQTHIHISSEAASSGLLSGVVDTGAFEAELGSFSSPLSAGGETEEVTGEDTTGGEGVPENDLDPWWLHPTPVEPPQSVLALASRLSAAGSELSPLSRIRLAYSRGRQAASIYREEQRYFSGERCRLRNRCYVVLHSDVRASPFFTWNLRTHQEAVRCGAGGSFRATSLSHGFASQAKALAFCLGAGLPSLPTTA